MSMCICLRVCVYVSCTHHIADYYNVHIQTLSEIALESLGRSKKALSEQVKQSRKLLQEKQSMWEGEKARHAEQSSNKICYFLILLLFLLLFFLAMLLQSERGKKEMLVVRAQETGERNRFARYDTMDYE